MPRKTPEVSTVATTRDGFDPAIEKIRKMVERLCCNKTDEQENARLNPKSSDSSEAIADQ